MAPSISRSATNYGTLDYEHGPGGHVWNDSHKIAWNTTIQHECPSDVGLPQMQTQILKPLYVWVEIFDSYREVQFSPKSSPARFANLLASIMVSSCIMTALEFQYDDNEYTTSLNIFNIMNHYEFIIKHHFVWWLQASWNGKIAKDSMNLSDEAAGE